MAHIGRPIVLNCSGDTTDRLAAFSGWDRNDCYHFESEVTMVDVVAAAVGQISLVGVNGHLKVPICGHEKSPPLMAGSRGLRWPTSSRPSLLHPEGVA